jgi:hypothetical protein
VHGVGAVTVLEDDGRVPATGVLGGGDLVVLGERQCQRLLAQHPGTGLQGGDGLLAVERRWRADEHQVRSVHREHRGEISVPGDVRETGLGGLGSERVEPGGIHVGGCDQFGAVAQGCEGGQMASGDDRAGADAGGTQRRCRTRGG